MFIFNRAQQLELRHTVVRVESSTGMIEHDALVSTSCVRTFCGLRNV